jgi:ketosteroid isomerase-like protein
VDYVGAVLLVLFGATACAPTDETSDSTAQAEMQESAPAVDAATLIALEKAVWEDLAAGDSEAMRARMTDDFVLAGPPGFVVGADEWMAQMSGNTCEMESWSIDAPQVTVLSPTSAFLTYRNEATMACDGQPMAESEGFSTTVWVLRDGEWKLAYYSSFERG